MHHRRAFTFLELLVSISVLAVIVILLAQLFQGITDSWMKASSKVDRNRVGRTLMDFVGRELRGATLPVETPSPVDNPNLQFLINPPLSMVSEDYRNPHCIFWQAPVATEQSRGELAEVGYFVKWDEQGGMMVPSLRRFFVNPTVYDADKKTYVPNADFLIYKSWSSWLSSALLEKTAPADKASGFAGLVAENVLGLWVRFYGADGLEISNPDTAAPAVSFDSRAGYRYADTHSPSLSVQTRYLPSRITLSIAQLDSRHASLLGSSWTKVRALANAIETKDAADFLKRFQLEGESDKDFKRLLPGLRIYDTHAILENAR